jgi:hypothetical protein
VRSRGDGAQAAGGHGSGEFPGVDLDMLASDIAGMLARYEYPVDAASTDIRPALPAFLRAVTASAAAGETGTARHDPAAQLPDLSTRQDAGARPGGAPPAGRREVSVVKRRSGQGGSALRRTCPSSA